MFDWIVVGPDAQRGCDFLERSIAGALPDAVDGNLNLPGAAGDGRQCVCNRQAQVIMAVGRENNLFGTRHALANYLKQRPILSWRRVADGVRQVDGGRACLDRHRDHADQEIVIGAGRVLGRKFDVVDVAVGQRDHLRDAVDCLFASHLELVLEVDV